ncbi:hypothetical protein E3N88_34814 [Mikania micrantha]|uniref:Uncharacterized protein n=1 Tax=Mikania micrantha TaxID=192012 RepID=A0A5N6LZ78_9ASTR|nr:hypothetical protein E3N88_34814 [Mikania micrantha]
MIYQRGGGIAAEAFATDLYVCPIHKPSSVYHDYISVEALTKALAQLLTETLSSVINHSVYTVFSTWLPKDYHQYQKNQWKSEDQQRYMMKCEDSCSISMKKSLDTCISLEQCSVLGESTMKPEQEEIMQEVNGEAMGLGPPTTWMKQYENGKPKELILTISKGWRPKQRWAFRATGYGGPLIKGSSTKSRRSVTGSEILLDFMNWVITAQSESYKQTIEAVDSIEVPAVGFSKSSGVGTTTQQTGITIKQNNFIIQAITNLLEEVKSVKEDVKELRQEFQKGKASAIENEQLLEELNKKLETLTIGGEKLHKPKGPYYVFKDPYKILKEEQEKQKK